MPIFLTYNKQLPPHFTHSLAAALFIDIYRIFCKVLFSISRCEYKTSQLSDIFINLVKQIFGRLFYHNLYRKNTYYDNIFTCIYIFITYCNNEDIKENGVL